MRTFEITDEQMKKAREFHPKCKRRYSGAIGGSETFMFTPTSIGVFVSYKCRCGEVLDLNDYDKF